MWQQALECADLSALFAGDLSPSKARAASDFFSCPLGAALFWRQVAKAVKAVTSHRTPNPCPLWAKSHHCISDNLGFVFQFIHEFIRGLDAHAGFAFGRWFKGQNL